MAKQRFNFQRFREQLRSLLQRLHKTFQAFVDESMFWSPERPSWIYRFVHFWVLVWRSFSRNRCPARASALAYATLLALIPMLAIVMSVSSALLKGESEERIGEFIDRVVASVIPPGAPVVLETNLAPAGTNAAAADTNSPAAPVPAGTTAVDAVPSVAAGGTSNPPTVVAVQGPGSLVETNLAGASASLAAGPPAPTDKTEAAELSAGRKAAAGRAAISRQIRDFIQNTRSGTLGLAGSAALILVAIAMLSRVEDTLNDIWGVKRGRNWFTRISIYWTVLCLGPILLLVALGLASGPHLKWTQDLLMRMPHVMVSLVFQLLPVVVLCVFLSLVYMFVPNTRVRWQAAVIGGLVGGLLWHVNNACSAFATSRLISNSKIYGSLGVVPVFMAAVYLSWLIALFGAQVAYAFQNRKLYLQEKLAENVNQRGREFVALRLMTCLGQRFQRGLPAPTIEQMSGELGVPSRLVQQVLQTLLTARLVMEISGAEPAYAPARPLDNITAHHVLMAMRATPGQELVTRDEPVREEVYGEFARIQEAEKKVASSVTVLALVHRARTRLELSEPQPAEDKLRLKPALVPSIEPAASPDIEVAKKQVAATGAAGGESTPDSPGTAGAGNEVRKEATRTPATAASGESKPARPIQAAQKLAEPVSDAEREFPL